MSVRSNPSTWPVRSTWSAVEIGPGQIERDGDRDRLEGDAPLGGEVEPGPHPCEADPVELLLELREDRLEAGALDGQTKVADRGRPEIRLVKPGRLGGHGQ